LTVRLEVWSDVVCPWCYIGEHRLARALDRSPHGADVEVVWRPFQLDPRAPTEPQPVRDAYARKFGGPDAAQQVIARITAVAEAEGLPIDLDRAQRANTFDAHRLMAWARPHGHQGALGAALFRAYFVDGAGVADRAVLADLAAEVGLPRTGAADLLASDALVDEVRADLERARVLGITAVPSFEFPGGFVLPGAQEPEVFERILDRLASR
jgi:predicted DsbA family dithiol-disulfide isomerase